VGPKTSSTKILFFFKLFESHRCGRGVQLAHAIELSLNRKRQRLPGQAFARDAPLHQQIPKLGLFEELLPRRGGAQGLELGEHR